MLREFLKNSAIYGIGKFFSVLIGFITLPIITHSLSPEAYGTFDLLNLCLIILNITVALEISQAIARFIGDVSDRRDRQEYVASAYFFSFISYTIVAFIIYFFREPLSFFIFKSDAYSSLMIYLIMWLYLQGTHSFITSQYRWENKPAKQVCLMLFQSLCLLAFVLWFLKGNQSNVEGLLKAHLFSLAISVFAGLLLLIKDRILTFRFSLPKLKTMLVFSLPLVPSSIAVFSQNYIDRIMVSHMLDLEMLGLYSLAFKIAALVLVFGSIFQTSVVPLFYKYHQDEKASKLFGYTANIYLFFILNAIGGIILFLPELFYYLIGSEFNKAASLIPFLLISTSAASFYTFAPGLSIAKKTSYLAVFNIVGMVINIILNYFLIKNMGVSGAALATMLSCLLICFANVIVSQKYYKIDFMFWRMGSAVFLLISLAGSFYLFDEIPINLSVTIIKLLIVFIIFGCLFLILFPKALIQFVLKK